MSDNKHTSGPYYYSPHSVKTIKQTKYELRKLAAILIFLVGLTIICGIVLLGWLWILVIDSL